MSSYDLAKEISQDFATGDLGHFWYIEQDQAVTTATCNKLYCRAEFFKKSFFGRISRSHKGIQV